MKNTPERYGLLSKFLHWTSALLIFGLFAVGLYMTGLADQDPARRQLIGLHKSFGVLVLFFAIARIVWIRISPAPAMPSVFSDKEKMVTVGIRSLIYLGILAVPLAGAMMSAAAGYPVSFFGLFNMPSLIGKSKELHEIFEEAHEILAWGLIGLVALHVAGAMKHRLLSRGSEADVLARML